ncbi:MAG TPA: hypothetical protein VFI31_27315 [Pirellulales bacterium]|nr:hypothetical protein [Pirellulales bacterium]
MDYKLITAFESVRKQLKSPKFEDRLDKPLAYWAIATDRRLPLAFMGRSLRELLDTPFDELFATAGIGQKKIRTFLILLNRAAKARPLGALPTPEDEIDDDAAAEVKAQVGMAPPHLVSDALWVRWRDSVRKHGLQQEPLGRFAASLADMPHVIWYRPLGDYTELKLDEIRSLRTHGEKRVHAILEVFGSLRQILVHLDPENPLAVRIVPRFVIPIEDWVLRWLSNVGLPTKDDIQRSLVLPLLKQVRIDAGAEIHRLAEARIESQSTSVRKAAARLGLTRARIYQLLSEVSEIVNLRWPAGASLVGMLRSKMEAAGANDELLKWFGNAYELFFVRGSGHDEEEEAAPGSTARRDEPTNGNGNGSGFQERGRRNGHRASVKTSSRSRKG